MSMKLMDNEEARLVSSDIEGLFKSTVAFRCNQEAVGGFSPHFVNGKLFFLFAGLINARKYSVDYHSKCEVSNARSILILLVLRN